MIRIVKLLLFFFIFSTSIHAQFHYDIDQDLRKTIAQEELIALEPNTPQQHKKTVKLLFNSGLIFDQYEKSLAKNKLKSNDIALIYSFFKSSCEKITQGNSYSGSKVKAAYTAMNNELATYFQKNAPTNEQLQQKYDRLILKASWLLIVKSGYESAKYKRVASKFLVDNTLTPDAQTTPKEITKKPKEILTYENKNAFNAIEDIIMRTVTSYGLSGTYIYNQIAVLYKNGDLYIDPSEPLETLNIPASKRAQPKKWKSYRRNQHSIAVTHASNGKVSNWKKWFQTRPGKKGHTFNGLYETLDPFGGSTVINASTVYFDDQGRFAWSTVKGGSWNMNAVYIKSKHKGTYRIANYTIHLTYDSGKKEAFFFSRYPKSNDHFIIGKSHFVPKK